MIKNYFNLAWRNLVKNRQFTFLNLFGLSTGLACVILIFMWVSDEQHVDKCNEKDKQLYQVMHNLKTPGGILTIENTPGILSEAMSKEMPDVEYAAAFIPTNWFSNNGLFSFDDTHLRAMGAFASRDYFKIFTVDFTQGGQSELFRGKQMVAISEPLALKLFHTTDKVTGKTIEWNQEGFNGSYTVSGVFKDLPLNATNRFDALFNYDLFLEKNPKLQKWSNSDPNTYLLLRKGTDVGRFNAKLAGFLKTKNEKSTESLFVQRFSEKYLHGHYENGAVAGGRIQYVKLFSIIAIFILVIACINFMNLSTAKSLMRAKEVSIQKCIGRSRRSIILQFLGEAVLMAFLSLLIAVVMVAILLPAFSEIAGKDFKLQFSTSFLLSILALTFITGLIAGSYPSFYVSRFRAGLRINEESVRSSPASWIRKGLVVFQFSISVILIVSVLVVYRQMKLVQTTNLGYNRDQVIYFEKGGKLLDNQEDYKPGGAYQTDLATFIQKIKAIPGVINASNFRHNIINREGGTTSVIWPGKAAEDQTSFTDISAGYNFIETLGIEMKFGRPYSESPPSEKSKVIFNEAAIESMGLKNPIGKIVNVWGEDKEIIGVTQNFHFESLYKDIKPCFFDLTFNQRASKIMVRIKPGTEKATISSIANFYKEYTGESLDYRFLDDDYQALYASEQRVAVLSRFFAAIAIIVSCLGLFGLAAFTAQKRQKEISIRKVVGAPVSRIAIMLSADFLNLILIALLIALPISWWAGNLWLRDFAYRVSMGPDIFVITALTVIGITLLTISFQTIKAAVSNPIKNLRAE